MAQILKGKDVADAMTARLKEDVAALCASGVTPTLAILRVGERGDDIAYERGAKKRCESIGIEVRQILLPEDVSQARLIEAIEAVNADAGIHGCLMFRPLPKHLDEEAARGALAPEKDVDGITDGSLAGVFSGSGTGFAPCTAQACMELLAYYGIEIAGREAVVVGRSLVIGKPVAMMLMAKHATVTVCHSKTKDLAAKCLAADILVVAAGRAGLIGADGIGSETVVLDVGINVDAEGNLSGDVRAQDAQAARAFTPVPGGVGSVTTTVLAQHVIEAAQRQTKQ